MKRKTTRKTESPPAPLQNDAASLRGRELTRRRGTFSAIIRVLRVWSIVDRRLVRERVVGPSTRLAKTRLGRSASLAVRARYGDGEIIVEARERWAIAGLVVLVVVAVLAVIATLLA